MSGFAYIFLDEGGEFNFAPKGSRYFTMTGVSLVRPFPAYAQMIALKYALIERGMDIEYFHATEDEQVVRDQVFEIIGGSLNLIRVDSLIVEKSKTNPVLRDVEHFYPRMLGYLLRHVLSFSPTMEADEVLVVTDRLPVNRKKAAVEKAIKMTLSRELPATRRYRLFHHSSASCMGLQVADYCNWAIFRKWERGDARSYSLIENAVKSEFDIFKTGTMHYYQMPKK